MSRNRLVPQGRRCVCARARARLADSGPRVGSLGSNTSDAMPWNRVISAASWHRAPTMRSCCKPHAPHGVATHLRRPLLTATNFGILPCMVLLDIQSLADGGVEHACAQQRNLREQYEWWLVLSRCAAQRRGFRRHDHHDVYHYRCVFAHCLFYSIDGCGQRGNAFFRPFWAKLFRLWKPPAHGQDTAGPRNVPSAALSSRVLQCQENKLK